MLKNYFVKYWRQLLGGAVAIFFALFAGVVLARDIREVLAQPFRLNPLLVLLSFVIECAGLVLVIPIWRQMLSRFDDRSHLRQDFLIYCYSLLGVAVPGRFWSVVGRFALYERQGVNGIHVAAASLVEFVVTGLAGILVYGVATAVSGSQTIWQQPLIAFLFIMVAAIFIQPPIFNRLVQTLFRRAQPDKALPTAMGYRDLASWLLGESVVIVIGGLAIYTLLESLTDVPSSLLLPVITSWAAAIIAGTLFFWLPSPVIRDGMMTFILAQALPTATALFFVILIRVWTIASILTLVALVWLFLGRKTAVLPLILPKITRKKY